MTGIKLDGSGTDTLCLPLPILEVSSITNGTVSITSDDYVIYNDVGELVLTNGTVWAKGRKNITLTVRFGYESGDLPADVLSAGRLWCRHQYQHMTKKRAGVISWSAGDESVSYESSTGMPAEVRDFLDPHRLLGGLL